MQREESYEEQIRDITTRLKDVSRSLRYSFSIIFEIENKNF